MSYCSQSHFTVNMGMTYQNAVCMSVWVTTASLLTYIEIAHWWHASHYGLH